MMIMKKLCFVLMKEMVVELDDMVAIAALNETQTKWAIITPEDIVVPPDELTDY